MKHQRTELLKELLKVIAKLSEAFPEWRMGQLISNLATSAGKLEAGAVWDLEDDEALAAAQRLLERRKEGALAS
jgi:hypothetical protein